MIFKKMFLELGRIGIDPAVNKKIILWNLNWNLIKSLLYLHFSVLSTAGNVFWSTGTYTGAGTGTGTFVDPKKLDRSHLSEERKKHFSGLRRIFFVIYIFRIRAISQ